MRVLHVITGLEAGGAEQWLRLLLRHGTAEADVLGLTNPGVVAAALRADGVRVTDLGMRGNRDVAAIPRLVQHVRRGRYDLVHTHLYRAQVYGAVAARLAGVRAVVSTEHSLNDRLIEGRPTDRAGVRRLYLAAGLLTTRIVAVSEPVAARLVAWGVPEEKVVVVPVGIDAAAFAFDAAARREVRAELGLAAEGVVVGGVGRLVEPKRFDVLLRAVAAQPDVAVLLVGDGPAREPLAALAAELGMAGRVRFAGQRLDVARLLSAMDVFASPSPEETFGVALLEALAAGLPVAYAAAPALAGLAPSPDVRLVEPTPEAFAAAVAELARGAFREHRAAATSVGLAHYDVPTLVRRMDRVYEECVAEGRRAGGRGAGGGGMADAPGVSR